MKMYIKYSVFLTVFVINFSLILASKIIVSTDYGEVEGKVVTSIFPKEKYYNFLGIPYALPPIDDLRFMPPQPHPGWNEVLNCKKERSSCPQQHRSSRKASGGFHGDEDCLYLNVQTPTLPANDDPKLPVIVLFINSQLRETENITKNYGPDFFMKEGVIIVTINHRLGALGFLSYEDNLLPGNNGLRDIILALQWIQENIQYFGGDPDNVTLMGSQGGAAIADMMLYIESAKGLFHKIIMQSGTSWQSMYFGGQAKKRAKALAETLEWSAPSSSMLINYLKKVSAADICAAEDKSVHADEARSVQKGIAPFIPIVEHEHDEALITKLPEESNIDIDIPIMIGYNSREILDMGSRYLHKPQYLTFADRDFLMMLPIRTGFNLQINDNIYFEAIQEVRDFYFDEGYVKTKKPGEYLTYLGDGMVTYPIDYTVRQYVNKSKAPVYYYTFDYSGEWNWRKIENLQSAVSFDGTWGASATDDLSYLFIYNKERSAYRAAVLDKGESEELTVLKNMIRLWTNFAKYGNPTPEGDEFIWKPATKENKECLVITEELEMRNNLHEDRMKFWDDFIEKYRAKAIDGVVYDVKEEL